jgi:hypothetical protein
MTIEFSVERESYVIDNEKRLWIHESVDMQQVSVESSSLYIFTKASDYTNKGIVKIGETGSLGRHRSVRDRLYEQPNSKDTEPLLLLFALDCKKYIESGIIKSAKELESYLHKYFSDVKWGDGAGTEWFRVDVSEVIKLVRIKLGDDKIDKIEFKPHFLQEVVLLQCLDAIENEDANSVNIIAELCARFGKTLTYLELFRRLDNDVMILPSYVHTVFTSFENEIIGKYKDEEIGKWSNFEGFKVIDTTVEGDWVKKFEDNLGKSKLVVFVSVQTREDSFSKFDLIKSVDNSRKFIVVDEADFGAHTENSKKIIDYLTE